MATRNKNHLKTLINAFRVVGTSADDLAQRFTRVSIILHASKADEADVQHAEKVLDAVLADMRAEDDAAKKPAE